jgi:hypothetical protein
VNASYAVTIKYPNGHVLRATVTKETLKGFRLAACRNCSVSIVKVG